MTKRLAALLALALAAAAPQMPAGQPAPIASPYDTTADAHRDVDAAFAAAKTNGHRVLLDFGGNWCPDCRMLAGVLHQPEMQSWLTRHFEVVYIDVGRFKKNLDIAEKYGVKLTAAPTVLVATPDGNVLNRNDVFALADARTMSGQAVADLLAHWDEAGR